MITMSGNQGNPMQGSLLANTKRSFLESKILEQAVSDLTFVAFDTETTGRHPIISNLIEVSGVKFSGSGKLLDVRTQLINPGRPIPQETIEIHGIDDEMVRKMPSYEDVIPHFVRWMQTGPAGEVDQSRPNVFLAHNAVFDVSFLQVALTRMGMQLPENPVLDTLPLSRRYYQNSKNHRLKTLIERLGESETATFHRAEADSRHLMKVFLDLLKRVGKNPKLADLIEAGGVMFFSKPFEEIRDHHSSRDLKVRRIGDAITHGADLFIHYHGRGAKFRQITPFSVLYSGKRYYLCAYCHSAGNERTFKVDRISSMEFVPRMQAGN